MAFRPTEKQARALEARGCVHHITSVKRILLDEKGEPRYMKDKDGNLTRDYAYDKPMIVCTITDTVTRRVVARAESTNTEEAFARALAAAHDAPMPKTPAEIESENVKLKRRVAELEAQRGAAPAVDSTPDPNDERESEDDPLAALREEAEMLGIQVDLRWGEKRLRREIATVEAEGQAEINQKMAEATATE